VITDESNGRANYEAFTAALLAWIPTPPAWEKLSEHIRNAWIAAAKAVRSA
jgi:hypothetical protein